MPRRPSISVVIPSRDGRQLLQSCLPPLLRELIDGDEVIIVDDASTDGTAEFLRSQFPMVAMLRLGRSRGFGDACNAGVGRARARLVLLINNDMVVEAGFLDPLAEHFRTEDIFAVGAQYRMRRGLQGAYVCSICGSLHHENENVSHGVTSALDAPAGGGLFDRQKLLALGCFDPLFRPFYWEDMDLGYRAWQRGWRILREPRSIMYHEEGATIRSLHSQQRAEIIYERNRLLFVWKNVRDWDLLVQHCCRIGLRAAQDLFVRTGMISARAAVSALFRLPHAACARLSVGATARQFEDREVAHRALQRADLFLDQLR